MVEDRHDGRDLGVRQSLPFLELFRGFQVAIDFRKLLLAAAGILTMAFAWWVLAIIFYNSHTKPDWPGKYTKIYGDGHENEAFGEFKSDRDKWNLLHQAAGPADAPEYYDTGDVATNLDQYNKLETELKPIRELQDKLAKATLAEKVILNEQIRILAAGLSPEAKLVNDKVKKPSGELRTWPWFENRGPNPFLLVTGQAGAIHATSEHGEPSVFRGLLVLIEPLVKFLLPVVFLLSPHTGFWTGLYFILVILATLAVWALFGGAITRMAAVELTRREKVGLVDALRFAGQRFVSFFTAPLFPLLFVVIIVVLCILFGFLNLIPLFGDIVMDGLLWPLIILAGLVMAVVLIGLVGWPMMSATISTEGTDSWEAVSRSYSYVYQAPWYYLWYSVVAIAYGAVLVFFVGFMGSLTVYLGKWAIDQTPFIKTTKREPSYLFVYAPTSYQWRELLLAGGQIDGEPLVSNGKINDTAYKKLVGDEDDFKKRQSEGEHPKHDYMYWWNHVGAFLVSIWIYLLFLMILGFGYSYFWTASTIIYLLMRRKVDDAELDEVYLEEDDHDDFGKEAAKSAAPPAPPAPPATSSTTTMVESPSLRVSSAPPPPPAPPPLPPAPPPSSAVTPATPSSPSPPASGPTTPTTKDGNSPSV